MHISIATEQITVRKIPKKLLSKCPPEFGFFSPDAYAVPSARGTPLPLLHRKCLLRATISVFSVATQLSLIRFQSYGLQVFRLSKNLCKHEDN